MLNDHAAEPSGPKPVVSRRRVLVAGVAGLGATLGLSRLSSSQASAIGSELNAPGKALSPAERIPPPTTTTTTTTTTTAPTTTVPPVDGEILFPIIVGENDTCFVGDNFGACRSGCSRLHEGTDMMADRLLPIRATANGVLTKRYVDSGLLYGAGHGWTLLDEENNITYKFFHMDHHAEGLEEGDTVEIGQVIGAVGNTGTSGANSDTNYHLHFEYRPNNVAMNSYHLLQRAPHVDFV